MSAVNISVWNETPDFYVFTKKVWSIIPTITFYPLAVYSVLFKSPAGFGSLRWFLLLHVLVITTQWLSECLFIDPLTFVPLKVTRVNGILVNIFDPVLLFKINLMIISLTSTTNVLLFLNRVFTIINMYRGVKTWLRIFLELIIYMAAIGYSSFQTLVLVLPDQNEAKRLTKELVQHYPNCLDDPNVIVLFVPSPSVFRKAITVYLSDLVITSVVFFSTSRIAYFFLARRMRNQSKKTIKMHETFNQRTFLQYFLNTAVAQIPVIVGNFVTLFQWYIPSMTLPYDFITENTSHICILSLFLFYDPYRKWLKKWTRTLCPGSQDVMIVSNYNTTI